MSQPSQQDKHKEITKADNSTEKVEHGKIERIVADTQVSDVPSFQSLQDIQFPKLTVKQVVKVEKFEKDMGPEPESKIKKVPEAAGKESKEPNLSKVKKSEGSKVEKSNVSSESMSATKKKDSFPEDKTAQSSKKLVPESSSKKLKHPESLPNKDSLNEMEKWVHSAAFEPSTKSNQPNEQKKDSGAESSVGKQSSREPIKLAHHDARPPPFMQQSLSSEIRKIQPPEFLSGKHKAATLPAQLENNDQVCDSSFQDDSTTQFEDVENVSESTEPSSAFESAASEVGLQSPSGNGNDFGVKPAEIVIKTETEKPKGILKDSRKSPERMRSPEHVRISEEAKEEQGDRLSRSRDRDSPRSILKQRSRSSDSEDEHKEITSILKRRSSASDSEPVSILKSPVTVGSSPSDTPPPSILKNRSDSLPGREIEKPASILKSRSVDTIDHIDDKPHSILKQSSQPTSPTKEPSILRFGPPPASPTKMTGHGILKKKTVEAEPATSSSSGQDFQEPSAEMLSSVPAALDIAPSVESVQVQNREGESSGEEDIEERIRKSKPKIVKESDLDAAGKELLPILKQRREFVEDIDQVLDESDIDSQVKKIKPIVQIKDDADIEAAGKELQPILKQRREFEKESYSSFDESDIDYRIKKIKPQFAVREDADIEAAGNELKPILKLRRDFEYGPSIDEIGIDSKIKKSKVYVEKEDADIDAAHPELQPILKQRREFAHQQLSVDEVDTKIKRHSLSGSGSDTEGAASELAERLRIRREREAQLEQQASQSGEEGEPPTCPVEMLLAVRKQLKHTEESSDKDEEQDKEPLSIQDRILRMQTKLESGKATPSSLRRTSTDIDEKFDKVLKGFPMETDEQLLTQLDNKTSPPMRQRRYLRFDRNGDRYRTQPVTLAEKTVAESPQDNNEQQITPTGLEFKSLVLEKSAHYNVFEQREKELKKHPLLGFPSTQKSEFPQPFRLKGTKPKPLRRGPASRYKTLPVTIGEIEEAEEMKNGKKSPSSPSRPLDAFRKNLRKVGQHPEQHPSSDDKNKEQTICSGNDNEEEQEDSLCKMSIADKMNLFTRFEREQRLGKEKMPIPRHVQRRMQWSRAATQPVTDVEVKEASMIAEELEEKSPEKLFEKKSRLQGSSSLDSSDTVVPPTSEMPVLATLKRDDDGDIDNNAQHQDEASQSSLMEKLHMFTKKPVEKDEQYRPSVRAVRRRQFRQSRFSTQPVTIQEVQTAVKLNPLVASLIKPPDVDSLSGLPINAARGMAYKLAKDILSGSTSKKSAADISNREGEESDAAVQVGVQSNPTPVRILRDKEEVSLEVDIKYKSDKEDCDVDLLGKPEKKDSVDPTEAPPDIQSQTKVDSNTVHKRHTNGMTKHLQPRPVSMPAEIAKIENCNEKGSKTVYAERHHPTAPITDQERDDADSLGLSSSIAERLAALQKAGERAWKKRVPGKDIEVVSSDSGDEMVIKYRDKKGKHLKPERPKSLSDRLIDLNTSSEKWRNRVGEKDVEKFTVAGKMGVKQPESPLVKGKQTPKRSPKQQVYRSKTDTNLEEKAAAARSILGKSSSFTPAHTSTPVKSQIQEQCWEERGEPARVCVPTTDDDGIEKFFTTKFDVAASISEDVDFDAVLPTQTEKLSQLRSVKPARRKAGSKNPLRALAARSDLRDTYCEDSTGIADREMKRLNKEKIAKSSGLAESALAGLASTENFSNVSLREAAKFPKAALVGGYLPYLDVMLLQIKGRRHVQTRLVEPSAKSLNHGDCFILVTPETVFQWMGEFSNVIERSKAADIAQTIRDKKDLSFTSMSNIIVIDENSLQSSSANEFWKILQGSPSDVAREGQPDEDDTFEQKIVDTNVIYKVEINKLIPYDEYWGLIPKHTMLKKTEILVFDFGSEMYVWQGRQCNSKLRKSSVALARELWEEKFDYSNCDINPIYPKEFTAQGSRPKWALFAKINQNMENILFREKFLDWPDDSRLIKGKLGKDISKKEFENLVPCDAKSMLDACQTEPDIILEQSHLGRGIQWRDEGEMRNYAILTQGIEVWHVMEYDRINLQVENFGQFHSGDTYVIRWQYQIAQVSRSIRGGNQSRHSKVGRERCAYFFWQGSKSALTDQGASALMTVELDEEMGPQIQVLEGKEPPCFCNLWEGGMIIHRGKREEAESCTQGNWTFYAVRGEMEKEVCLYEVEKHVKSLRSRTSFVLVNKEDGEVYIWHGCKSKTYSRRAALAAVRKLVKRRPLEVGFGVEESEEIDIYETEEGSEDPDFIDAIGSGDRELYDSLLNDPDPYDNLCRLFEMSSVSGTFKANEMLNPCRNPKLPSPFPFLQEDLYKSDQPGLFMLDAGNIVYLWQGWWPDGTDDTENVVTGSGKQRFSIDRRCAMQTTLNYCKEKFLKYENKQARLVLAGCEPLKFKNLFPFWTDASDDILNSNKLAYSQYTLEYGEIIPIQDVLDSLSCTQYSLERLRQRPLPEGVDPKKLESYLSPIEFEENLKMTKEEFYSLPDWKRTQLKQKIVGIF